jgi:branched-chain amino acid transport system permease protein
VARRTTGTHELDRGAMEPDAAPPVAVPASDGPTGESVAATRPRTRLILKFILGLAAVAALLLWVPSLEPFWLNIVNLAIIAALAALGLDLITGHAGIVSAGNAAFMGVGALVAAQAATYWNLPFLAAVVLGGLGAAIAGVIVAVPSLRISGLYVAIGTLAIHFIVLWLFQTVQQHQVGEIGYSMLAPSLFGLKLFELKNWYFVLLAILALVTASQRALIRTKPGRALHAIREQPAVASMSGVNVAAYKITAFALSSFVIGVSGALWAFYIGNVSYATFTLTIAIQQIAMVVVGGMGSIYGPIAGAFLLTSLPQVLQRIQTDWDISVIPPNQIFFVQGAIGGLAIALVIMFQPRGLAEIARQLVRLGVRLLPSSKRHGATT